MLRPLLAAALIGLSSPIPAAAQSDLGLAVGLDALRWQSALDLHQEFADYADLGVTWLRTDLNWAIVQSEGPDHYDWSVMDRIMDLCRRYDIRLLPVIGSVPDWAGQDPDRPSPPRDADDFANFITHAVARYAPQGVKIWEIWNEPNLSGPWPPRPDPVAYTALLTAASAAIKKADPEARIVLGGLAAVQSTGPLLTRRHIAAVEFLQTIYDQGGRDAFDMVGFHPYSYPDFPDANDPGNGWGLMAGPIRQVMAANGDADKPIWITEYGAPTNSDQSGVTQDDQAQMLAQAITQARDTDWAGPVFWYSYKDIGTDPEENEDWFGMISAQDQHKPARSVFRALSRP